MFNITVTVPDFDIFLLLSKRLFSIEKEFEVNSLCSECVLGEKQGICNINLTTFGWEGICNDHLFCQNLQSYG